MLYGSAMDNVLRASTGDDVLDGRAGHDILDAGTADMVSFDDAVAEISVNLALGTSGGFGAGRDTLAGFEQVLGLRFSNLIICSAGDDVVQGGDGNDTMRGDGGRDTFLIGASLLGDTDRVVNFVTGAGEDVIDVSAIDANALASGNQAFVGGTAAAAGVFVRGLVTVAGVSTTNYAFHVDNDAVADMTIALSGLRTLTAGTDFIT